MKQLTVLVLLSALSTACGLFDEGDSAVIDGDWPVDRPASTAIAPGQAIELHVTGVDVSAKQLYVWLYDDALTLPPAVLDDGEIKDDGELTITIWAPFFESGEHVYYLGDAEGHRSGAITANVVIPTPRLPKAEAARLLAIGMEATLGEVEALLADPAPEWQQFWGTIYTAAERGKLDELMTELHTVTPALEQAYNELSDEHEAALQSFLEHRGILINFEAGLALISTATARTRSATPGVRPDVLIDVRDRLPHPISRVLYTLDYASLLISVAGDTLTIITIACAVVPGLQPVSGVSALAELIPYAIRFVIDNIVPTDLYDVSEEMVQEVMFRDVGAHTYYWGTYSQENRSTGGVVGSLGDALAAALGQFLGVRKDVYAAALQEIVSTLGVKLGLKLPTLWGEKPKASDQGARISTIMNMQLYGVVLSDLIALNPLAVMFKLPFAWVDLELGDPFSVEVAEIGPAAQYARNADAYMTYRDDSMYFQNDWPSTAALQRTHVYITAFSYRFTTSDFPYIVSVPLIDRVPEHERLTRLNYGIDQTDPNSTNEDHAFLLDTIPFDPTYQYWFNDESPTSVPIQLILSDLAGGRSDVAKVSISVNDVLVVPEVILTVGAGATQPLLLKRGKNTITVTATAGHAIPYQHGGNNFGTPVRVHVVEAANLDKNRTKYLNVGESGTIIVVTPPHLVTLPAPE